MLCAWVGHSIACTPAARSPVRRRCEAGARTASAQRRLDADTTISVDIGAHSGDKIGPEVDSAPVRVRAGDTRSAACTKTSRATPSHLAAPFAPEQLPQYQRIPGTSAASLAHQYMQQTGRTRLVHTSSGSWPCRRCCEAVAHTASAERRLDADTTISVDIGAHSGDDRA